MTSPEEPSLRRGLTLFSGILLTVGLIIGSGVFKKIVPMAQTGLDGDSILLAWLVAGLISLFGAFTFSGLASLTEESGGLYEYFRLSYGNFLAFLSGWTDFLIIAAGAVAALAFLFAQVINTIFPLPNPLEAWAHISIGGFIYPFADSGIKLTGIAAIILLTGVNCLGIIQSAIFNNILTAAKVLGILALAMFGMTYVAPEPIVTQAVVSAVPEPAGWMYYSAFMTAMLGAFWGYNGWEVVACISGEMINPKRNMPLAMVFGTLTIMALYLLANYSYLQVLSVDRIRAIGENEIAAYVVAETIFGSVGKSMLLALFLVCVFGALNSNMVTVPRKYFRMAQEGFFFSNARKVHPKFRTPYVSLIYTMVLGCIVLLSGSFDMLTDMVIFTSFLFYGLLALAVLRLKRNGIIKMKIIGYPVIPALFMLFTFLFCINHIWTQPKQSSLGLLLVLSGVPFYYYFKRKRNVAGGSGT